MRGREIRWGSFVRANIISERMGRASAVVKVLKNVAERETVAVNFFPPFFTDFIG